MPLLFEEEPIFVPDESWLVFVFEKEGWEALVPPPKVRDPKAPFVVVPPN